MMKKLLLVTTCTLPFAYFSMIFILSSYPSDAILQLPTSHENDIKEALHFIEFGILYIMLVVPLFMLNKVTRQRCVFMAFLAIFCGMMDEVHQLFVPSRSASMFDLFKDMTGVFVAHFIVIKIFEMKNTMVRKENETL